MLGCCEVGGCGQNIIWEMMQRSLGEANEWRRPGRHQKKKKMKTTQCIQMENVAASARIWIVVESVVLNGSSDSAAVQSRVSFGVGGCAW